MTGAAAGVSGVRLAPDGRTLLPPRGLPEQLPRGERLLWQGAPEWRTLARRAFRIRGLAVYFGVILTWSAAASLLDGRGAAATAASTLLLAAIAAVPVALAALYAWMVGRATTYTVTNRRVVMQVGLALPMTINLPFSRIEAASIRLNGDGTGDICLLPNGADRLAYLVLWPHARPWRFARTEPMLRAVPGASDVGRLLAEGLADSLATAEPPAPRALAAAQDLGPDLGPDLGEVRARATVAA